MDINGTPLAYALRQDANRRPAAIAKRSRPKPHGFTAGTFCHVPLPAARRWRRWRRWWWRRHYDYGPRTWRRRRWHDHDRRRWWWRRWRRRDNDRRGRNHYGLGIDYVANHCRSAEDGCRDVRTVVTLMVVRAWRGATPMSAWAGAAHRGCGAAPMSAGTRTSGTAARTAGSPSRARSRECRSNHQCCRKYQNPFHVFCSFRP